METVILSEAALSLLRRRLAREWVDVTEDTLPLYRELVAGGMMIPLSTFTRGAEGAFRLTELGCSMRDGVQTNGHATLSPSA